LAVEGVEIVFLKKFFEHLLEYDCWELNKGSFFQKIRTSDEAQSKGAAYLIFRLQKRLMVVFFEHF
jgi:hypothetical protein